MDEILEHREREAVLDQSGYREHIKFEFIAIQQSLRYDSISGSGVHENGLYLVKTGGHATLIGRHKTGMTIFKHSLT